jgi:hypothetical protein
MGRGGQYIGALLAPRPGTSESRLFEKGRMALSAFVRGHHAPAIREPEVVVVARVRLALWGVVLLLAACGNLTFGPNLDDAVRDTPAAEIRGKIAGHEGWDQRLSGDELDQLAEFLATYAGSGDTPSDDPGRAVWVTAGCSSCHTLRAGEP